MINLNSNLLSDFIQKLTKTKIRAFLAGIITTVMIQSSSGVTAIVVALICAELLDFKSGVLVILGSNIGTTFTVFLFSLEIEKYSLVFIIVSGIFLLFNSKKTLSISNILAGLGILFLGIDFMNQGFINISSNPFFSKTMLLLSGNRINSFITGTLLSMFLQSSSITINLSQNLFSLNEISILSAVSLMLGANLGTSIASLITSISATKEAKAVININIIFNLLGGLVFLIILKPFIYILNSTTLFKSNKRLTIAYSHLIFNIVSSLIFLIIFDAIINRTKKFFKLEKFNDSYNY